MTVFAVLLILFGLGWAGMGTAAARRTAPYRARERWPRVTGLVLALAQEEDPERPGRAKRLPTVTYRYRDAAGVEHEGRDALATNQSLAAGDPIEIEVDPTDPRRSRAYAPTVAVGAIFWGGAAFAVGGVALLGLGLWLLLTR